MNWRTLRWVSFGALVALLLALYTVSVRLALRVVRVPLSVLSHLIVPSLDVLDYPHLRADNERLRQTVATLTQQLLDSQTLQAENERLRGLMALRESSPASRLVAARVIIRNPAQWTRSVTINKGQREGLSVGTPVVSSTGIVGKVVAVQPTTSHVLLVTDPDVRIGVSVARTRDQGVAVGDGGWRIRVLYLPMDSEVERGDEVVASGLGGVFPQGLRVGRVAEVAIDPSQLYRVAVVEPSAPLGQLEDVGCLISR